MNSALKIAWGIAGLSLTAACPAMSAPSATSTQSATAPSTAPAGEAVQAVDPYLAAVDLQFRQIRDAAVTAQLPAKDLAAVDEILGRHRAVAAQHLAANAGDAPPHGVAKGVHPLDVKLAAESNAPRELSQNPALARPVTEQRTLHEALRLLVTMEPKLVSGLLDPATVPDPVARQVDAEAAEAQAKVRLIRQQTKDPAERGRQLAEVHRAFRRRLLDVVGTRDQWMALTTVVVQQDGWRNVLPTLTQMEQHPAILNGVAPPPDAVVSQYNISFVTAPEDATYELLAVGDAGVVRAVRLTKGTDVGFAMDPFGRPPSPFFGEESFDLPSKEKLYYWRIQKP